MTGESHCASGKLIVVRTERSGGRGRPLSPHVEAWWFMRVCWADRHLFADTETEWSDWSFRGQPESGGPHRCCGNKCRQRDPSELTQRSCHRQRAEDVLRADVATGTCFALVEEGGSTRRSQRESTASHAGHASKGVPSRRGGLLKWP